MKTVKTIIERAADGSYSVYHDPEELEYLITGTGETAQDALRSFFDGYEDTKRYHAEKHLPFTEANFETSYDFVSFLNYYSHLITLSGLSQLTGINKSQLSQYISGYRHASPKTLAKIESSLHKIGEEFAAIRLV